MSSYPRSSESRMNSDAFRAGMADGKSAFVPYANRVQSTNTEGRQRNTDKEVQRNMGAKSQDQRVLMSSTIGQRDEVLQQLTSKGAKHPEKFGCGIRSRAEDNHAYSEGRRRSPEEYANNLHVSFTQNPNPIEEKETNIKKIKNILLETTDSRRDGMPPYFHYYDPANNLQDMHTSKRTDMEDNTRNVANTSVIASDKEHIPPHHFQKTLGESTNSALVDKLTMEYMMNKQHYKKYLSKTNSTKYEETKQQIQKVSKYQEHIVKMVQELIKDFIEYGSFTKYNSDINHFFESFMISSVRYLEDNPHETIVNDDDDDVMFNI